MPIQQVEHAGVPRKLSLVYVRTHKTFLDFADKGLSLPCSSTSPILRRSSSDSILVSRASTADSLDAVEVEQDAGVNGSFLEGNEEVRPRREPDHKVFIGGMSCTTDELLLYQFLTRFGPVKNVTVKRNPVTGQSRRYAFVKFYQRPSSSIFEGPWSLDDHIIRVTKYQVSFSWKNHYYSDEE